MNSELHFSKSPLTEAVIDIRVKLSDEITLKDLVALKTGQEFGYPEQRNRIFLEGMFSANPQVPPAIGNRTHIGYDFVSNDKRQIVQVRRDGFTFSRLAPYDKWESFRNEAQHWWKIYREKIQPEAITRIAVRYINRLDLPLPIKDLKDYLRTVPEIAPDLPQELNGYFMQLQIPQKDLKGELILNETLAPPPNSEVVSIILDIDLFRAIDVPQSEDAIWEYFEQLRIRKNDVFLACLTERTKELIA